MAKGKIITGNGPTKGAGQAVMEVHQIQEIAKKLAERIGLDMGDGVLINRPNLMFLFMIENLLDRIEALEEIYPQVLEALKDKE